MLKRKILFLFLIFQTIIYAQTVNQDVSIVWNRVDYPADLDEKSVVSFDFDQAVFNGNIGVLPFFRFDIDLENDVQEIKVEILNQEYKIASVPKEAKMHPVFEDLADEFDIKTNIKTTSTGRIARIEFVPIKKDLILNAYSLLSSFSIQVQLIQNTEKIAVDDFAFAEESVLATGEWYKFTVDKTGVFKISGSELINAGLSISTIDPEKIAIYGFGAMLAEKNSAFRYSDLPELAIQVIDGNDGKFDASDYILFYAQGPDKWNYNSAKDVFEHELNIYDRNAYYYVHVKNEPAKRVESVVQPTGNATFQSNSFTDYAFLESELYNLIGSGRRWVGDKFEFIDSNSYDFTFDNLVPGSQAYLKAELVARSTVTSSYNLKYNSSDIGSISISKIPTGSYPAYAYDNTFEKYFQLSVAPEIKIDVVYNRPISSAVGWLDYLEINVKRQLVLGSSQLAFRCPESIGEDEITNYSIVNTTQSTSLWEVTDLENVGSYSLSTSGNLGEFKAKTDELLEFVAFTENMAFTTEFVEKIENQNLHAVSDVDMIIICPQEFINQANDLADFHRQDGLNVQVSSLYQIYNEFSSGAQDVTAIRDYVRAVYMKSSTTNPLRYLLLFGDASFDYMDRESVNTNLVPTFESYESFDPIISIAIDDYFGFLDTDEGDMYYDDIDIGIGRLPVVSVEEAIIAVAKIKHYAESSAEVKGDWRNVICFVADDEDNNLHIRQADDLAQMVDTIFAIGNLDKIYVDAFSQISTPAGQRYPKVNEAINERVDRGALILSYTGHGGETGWGQERYLDMPDIESWSNYDKLPVFLTATCEFARFDDPQRVSAGEFIFLNEKGGGIALFTTSRATYAGSNFVMSKHFYNFTLNHPDKQYLRMGDILKETKRASGSGFNVMKFVLLGDPALKLNIPKNYAEITKINQQDVGQENDTLKALSFIHIQGQISDINGAKLNDFNGQVYPLVFDKVSEITTLGNDPGSVPFSFDLQKNVLYKGKAEVKNGDFEFSFVVPKDIAYNFGKGKLSLYAASEDTDAAGCNQNIIIGGFDENSQTDTQGPDIELFLNDVNFIEGGMTNENPVLIARISDENGINTIGNGIGHDITAVLDVNTSDIKILNDFYQADANTYKSGIVEYPFYKLDDGEHELSFKVWDIYNNSSSAKLKFLVSGSANLALDAVMNYPNPFYDETVFSFEHNGTDGQLQLSIDIFNMSGQLVKHLEDSFETYSSRINHMHWDGTDQHGSKIMKGMYIYRLQLTNEDGIQRSKTSKLVYLK